MALVQNKSKPGSLGPALAALAFRDRKTDFVKRDIKAIVVRLVIAQGLHVLHFSWESHPA